MRLLLSGLLLMSAGAFKDADFSDKEEYYLNVTIRNAQCYAANTSSAFTVALVSLDYYDKYLGSTRISYKDFRWNEKEGAFVYRRMRTAGNTGYDSLAHCFQRGQTNCLPRADVIFIDYKAHPDDAWAIDQIDVDVHFVLGPGREHVHMWHFEHAVLRPCYAWLKDPSTYQIGPRNGLFIQHPTDYMRAITNGTTHIRIWV